MPCSRARRHQLHGCVDRRHSGHGQRSGAVPRPGIQRYPHHGSAGANTVRDRTHPANREVGAVCHSVEEPLAHRYDRHRLAPRPCTPGSECERHRLRPRPHQLCPRHSAYARRHSQRVLRTAATTGRRVRSDEQAVARARRLPRDAGIGIHRRRQVHDLSRHG